MLNMWLQCILDATLRPPVVMLTMQADMQHAGGRYTRTTDASLARTCCSRGCLACCI